MAEDYLETGRHRDAAETMEQCYSDQMLKWQLVICDQLSGHHWQPGTRSSGDEVRHRTAHPADLLDLTMSRDRVADPKWMDQEQAPNLHQYYIRHHFV